MLRDITIGQHFPGESVLHRLDPRIKILLTLTFIIVLFASTNPIGLTLSVVFIAVMYAIARIPARTILRSIKPIVPILIFTSVLNLFFYTGQDEPIFSWWVLKITPSGIYYAITMGLRIICLIVGAGLLTYTTSPIALTDGIERLLSPLARFHFPAHELAMMMTIALRFIPVLIEETDKIMSAQKARGAQLDSGGLMARIRALIPVLIPLFLSAFRRAEELAMAMECRCYHGGEGRTRLRQLRITGQDILSTAVCLVVFAAIAASGWVWRQFGLF